MADSTDGKQYRSVNGKFGKRKNDESRKKALDAMKKARNETAENKVEYSDESVKNFKLDGCRIVDLKEFAKTLKCFKCQEILDLETAEGEKRSGFSSTFTIICKKSKKYNNVSTSKVHEHEKKEKSDIN